MTDIDIRPTPSSELALRPEFLEAYPVLDPERLAALSDAVEEDGLELSVSSFTRVKVPTGAGLQWAMPDPEDDDQVNYVRELVGIVVAIEPRRSYWSDPEPSGKAPECRSVDLKVGEGLYGVGSELHPTGACDTCPMNARGSAGKEGSQASACKEQRLLFFATAEELLPLMVSVPAGSLKPLNGYRTNLLKRQGKRLGQVETRLTLVKQTSANGTDYAQIKFSNTGKGFDRDELRVITEYGAMITALVKASQDEINDFADGAATFTGDATPDVPFDADGLPLDEMAPAADAPAAEATDAGKSAKAK